MKKPSKRKAEAPEHETAGMLEVMRCSKCGQDRLPVVEHLGEPTECKRCSWCGAENSFGGC